MDAGDVWIYGHRGCGSGCLSKKRQTLEQEGMKSKLERGRM